ncbi:MAG: PQQ-dependent sugar dehydrogenase [Woeseiaceae bacterium]|nr:PQQ-dependent sugar dehydrogenase [Woeseiaceae bacterium]
MTRATRTSPESFAKQVLSKGRRSPHGLEVDQEGAIFETEHAERGGDEINRIEPGKNYGWPIVTYGTNYDETTWCNWCRGGCKERQGTEPEIQNQHEGYEKPSASLAAKKFTEWWNGREEAAIVPGAGDGIGP